MTTLQEVLGTQPTRGQVVSACGRLIDDEVSRKGGLTSIPLKAGYKMVKGLRPGFVPGVVDFLLDEFCQALQPFYATWAASPAEGRPSLQEALRRDQEQVAEALLGVTDRRADRSTNRAVVKVYKKLRSTAKGHVKEALPGLGRAIEPFLKG